jgi:hypothetical protein
MIAAKKPQLNRYRAKSSISQQREERFCYKLLNVKGMKEALR